MKLAQFLHEGLVVDLPDLGSKRALLQSLVERATTLGLVTNAEDVLKRLLEREAQGSTGIGQAIAIPHCSTESVTRQVMGLARIKSGCDFDSLDGQPVCLVFLILCPPGKPGLHLKLLARVARLTDREDFRTRLMQSGDDQELMAAVVDEDSRHP